MISSASLFTIITRVYMYVGICDHFSFDTSLFSEDVGELLSALFPPLDAGFSQSSVVSLILLHQFFVLLGLVHVLGLKGNQVNTLGGIRRQSVLIVCRYLKR